MLVDVNRRIPYVNMRMFLGLGVQLTSFPNFPGNDQASQVEQRTTHVPSSIVTIPSPGRRSETRVQDIFPFTFQSTINVVW